MTTAALLDAPAIELSVEEVCAVAEATAPTLCLRLRIDAAGREVRALALHVQIRIEATRRVYAEQDEALLLELFGPRERWRRTLRSLPWTSLTLTVPRFSAATTVDLNVPATYDFEVVGAKYLNALGDGDVPLELLFSGTCFYTADDGRLLAAPLPGSCDLRTSLPVRVWREALDAAFPNAAWLRLDRDTFDRLWAFRAARAIPSWEATVDELLAERR